MPFENRIDAGERLAVQLAKYRGLHPLGLAIPRGAVPMGKIVADALEGELDVVLVRKLRAPGNPELAIGSIDELGTIYLEPELRSLWTDDYLEDEKDAQLRTLRERREAYGRAGPPIDPNGRTVIVLDDGVATGSTMIAALRAVRARHPARLIAATAVAPSDTLARLASEADEVVCVEVPERLYATSVHFRDFSQVSDHEVVELLTARDRSHAAQSKPGDP